MCRKFSTAPANSSAPANSADKISENFVHEINSTAHHYPRKYGIYKTNRTIFFNKNYSSLIFGPNGRYHI